MPKSTFGTSILSSATVKFWNGSLSVNQNFAQSIDGNVQRRVVVPHRLDIVAAGDRDAVFGAFELRLQRQEILVGLQVGIVLDHREQPRQRAGQAGLALLECLNASGSLSASGDSVTCVALARASTTPSSTSFSCAA